MCVADKRGFLLVSGGRGFLVANFSDHHSDLYLPFWLGVGTVSYQKINLLGSRLFAGYSFQLVLFACVRSVSSTG